MTAIILTLAGVGTMCASGFGVATALKWFNTLEFDMSTKKMTRDEDGTGVGSSLSSRSSSREYADTLRKRLGK